MRPGLRSAPLQLLLFFILLPSPALLNQLVVRLDPDLFVRDNCQQVIAELQVKED
jgi:hypothetical protein